MAPPTLRVAWYVPALNERRAGLRYRCLYPIAGLRQRGITASLYTPAQDCDVVVFDAWQLFPSVSSEDAATAIVELARELQTRGIRVLLDNCDNQFAGAPDQAWQRALERLRSFARNADAVVTCSTELARRMQLECGLREMPLVIDDPLEESIRYSGDSWWRSLLSPGRKRSWARYLRHRASLALEARRGITPLVWFGAHGNSFAEGGMLDLRRVTPILAELHAAHPISLTVVSNHRGKFDANFSALPFPTHYQEWDRVTFLAMLKLHVISLIPVVDNEFTRCKSANRLTLSLHHGLNVVADAMPSYQPFADVCALDDWRDGLRNYLAVPGLRRQHLLAGQAQVRQHFSLAQIAQRWEQALLHTTQAARHEQTVADTPQGTAHHA